MADEQPFPVRQLLGGKIASQTQALAGMKRAEEEQARRLDEARQSQQAQAEAMAPVQKSLGALGGAEETVAGLEKLADKASARELAMPEIAQEKERIFPGSVGLTRVPPYDYRWTWNAQDGGPRVSVSADNATGQLGLDLDSRAGGHAWCANGVGVYYRPVYNGTLQVWANPSFNYYWYTSAWLSSCHSDGWLGLYVGQYNFAGALDWTPISQQIYQWRDDNWFTGAGSRSGSNSGYPLSAWIPVNTSHWYAIWVWSGGAVGGTGWGIGYGSEAASKLNVGVPSINMALY